MVGLLIFFPQLVTFGLDKDVKVDLDSVQIEMPTSDYGAPATPAGSENPQGSPADARRRGDQGYSRGDETGSGQVAGAKGEK
jgi:hypothetical protein